MNNYINYSIGDILFIKHGFPFKSVFFDTNGELICLGLGNIYESGGFKPYSKGNEKWYIGEYPKEYLLKKGDMIIALTEQVRGLLGATAWIPENNLFLHNQRLGLVLCNENKVDKFFVYQLFRTKSVREQISRTAQGTKQRNTSPEKIYEVKITIPSDKNYQIKVGKLLCDIDAKIELNNRINTELESMAKMLYDYWFVQYDFPFDFNQGKPCSHSADSTGVKKCKCKSYKSSGGKMVWNNELKRDIPAGWEIRKVEDYCRIFTGKKDVNQALEKGRYKFFSCAPGYKFSDEKLYEGKAILISGNGSYTGRTIFIDDAFDLYQRTYACVNKTQTDILPYIYYSMLRYLSVKVGGGTHGSAIPYIIYDDLAKENLSINFEVIYEFQKFVYPLLNEIKNLTNQSIQLTNLRDWLLPMLMNGQVKVS